MDQPVKRSLKHPGRGHLVDHFAAAPPRGIRLQQRPRDGCGGKPFVHQHKRAGTDFRKIPGKGAGGLRGRAGRAVHVERQADDQGANAVFRDQRLEHRSVFSEFSALERDQRGSDGSQRVAERETNGLFTEIESEQAVSRQLHRRKLFEADDGHLALPIPDPIDSNIALLYPEARMSVDSKTVRRIARLARIALDDEQATAMEKELNALLAWVEQLSEADVEGVPPMTSMVKQRLKMRADVVNDGGRADDVLRNAPLSEQGFFLVPKVVE